MFPTWLTHSVFFKFCGLIFCLLLLSASLVLWRLYPRFYLFPWSPWNIAHMSVLKYNIFFSRITSVRYFLSRNSFSDECLHSEHVWDYWASFFLSIVQIRTHGRQEDMYVRLDILLAWFAAQSCTAQPPSAAYSRAMIKIETRSWWSNCHVALRVRWINEKCIYKIFYYWSITLSRLLAIFSVLTQNNPHSIHLYAFVSRLFILKENLIELLCNYVNENYIYICLTLFIYVVCNQLIRLMIINSDIWI